VAALGLLCVLWLPTSLDEPYAFVFVFPFLVLTRRGLEAEPRSPGWLWESVAGALVLSIAFGAAFRVWVIWKHRDFLIERADGMDFWRLLIVAPGVLAWVLAAVTTAVVIHRRRPSAPALAAGALAVAVAVQATFFLLPQAESYRENYKRYHDDVAAVARFLEGKPGRPTVYWCNSNLGTVWLDLRAHSYFQRQQIQGLLFSRDTAAEARRRALLVGPFEMEYMQRESVFGLDRWTELMEHFHGVTCETASPSTADLERLCRDEKVDFVIVAQRFGGLYSASTGRFYVYDCRRVRAALKSGPERQAGVAMAGSPTQ
jgi:hypothetical protein